MPATKIETGIWIELKRLKLLPNARKHKPEKILSLAKSIQEDKAQLQDIIVCPQDETAGPASPCFDVLAGGGRKAAEEQIGWDRGRCTVMYGLSPYEKLKITLDENREREETSPMDEARIYAAMKEAEPNLSQEQLAQRHGMTRSSLADYLSLVSFPSQVQEIVARATNLGLKHLLQLCRVKTPEDQIAVAQEADQQELSVKELKALVDQRLKGGGGDLKPAHHDPYAALKAKMAIDPFGGSWPSLLDSVTVSGLNGLWSVKFENKKWLFGVNSSHIGSKEDLARWFLDMTKGLAPQMAALSPEVKPPPTDKPLPLKKGGGEGFAVTIPREDNPPSPKNYEPIDSTIAPTSKPLQEPEIKLTDEESALVAELSAEGGFMKKPLSPILQALSKAGKASELVKRASRMPTVELQNAYLVRYKQEKNRLLNWLDAELLPKSATDSVLAAASAQPAVDPHPAGVGDERQDHVSPAGLMLLALIIGCWMGVPRRIVHFFTPAPPIPAPQWLLQRWGPPGSRELYLSWTPVGPDYHYNIYLKPRFQKFAYQKQNEEPLTGSQAIYHPTEDPPLNAEFVVAAVDSSGHESDYSPPLWLDMSRLRAPAP